MEISQHGLLEELVVPLGRESWSIFPTGLNIDESFPNGWISSSFESLDDQNYAPDFPSSNSSLAELLLTPQESSFACPLADIFTKSHTLPPPPPPPFPFQDHDYDGMVEQVDNGEIGQLLVNGFNGFEGAKINCSTTATEEGQKKKGKVKKAEGQPSKNLMAERRRRKRLNDRLSMLRSIVPKISKMDRTSIVGDAINYIKDLLHKINELREDTMKDDDSHLVMINQVMENPTGFKPPNEVENPPKLKFDVERRHEDTRIEIRCATKPGLMLSTVSTLEAIGLDIQRCVISCFSTDFSFQASCTEAMEHRAVLGPEDVKQVLFKTAGYGGRWL